LCLFAFLCPVSLFSMETAPYLPAQQALVKKTNAPITVQFPFENMKLPAGAENIFVFGLIRLPNPVSLDINGQQVPIHESGTFVAYVPVQSGPFELVFTVSDGEQTFQAVRHITVKGKDIKDFSAKAAFDETEVFPQSPAEVQAGETITLIARGTPNAKVEASLSGLKDGKNILLTEDEPHNGMYRAQFQIDPQQKGKTVKVVYKMEEGPHKSKAKITAPAKITVRNEEEKFTYADITTDGIKLRSLPTAQGNLYPYYRAYGTVRVSGKMNNQHHIWLNEKESAWLENNRIADVAEPPAKNLVSGISTFVDEDKTTVTVKTSRPTPISIQEFADRLEATVYYVDGMESNFSIDNTSPLIETIGYSRPTTNTLSLKIYFKRDARLWGYSYAFEDNHLVITARHMPVFSTTAKQPLRNIRILIDAGHNPKRTAPYDGAVGPTGYLEYEGTLALAEELKTALEKKGATVILTRQGKNRLTLQQRYEHALEEKAHIFVSLHYNALPETANPLEKPRGFSVYYTYPHSFDLAAAVHSAYGKYVPLADNGMIANDVLFIPRISEMPSILVENAYLMFPEQEEMARTQQGREKLVQALQNGILDFFKKLPQTTKVTP